MSKCKYCGIELFWMQKPDGSYVPYEDSLFTKQHQCPEFEKQRKVGVPRPTGTETAATPSTQPAKAKVKVEPLSDEEIVFVRKFRHWCKELAP